MDAAVRVQALRCLTAFLSWLPASVGARSLRCSAIRSPCIRRRPACVTFSKTGYQSVARQPRPRQFRTTWRVAKELSIYVSVCCDKTHLSGPMKKHTTWQVFSLPQYGATNYLPVCYGVQQKSNHPPGSLTHIRNIRHLDENIVDIRVVSDIVMLVVDVGVRSLKCYAIRSPGIRRRPETKQIQQIQSNISYHGYSRRPATGHGFLPQDATSIKHCLVEHSNKQMHQESGHENMHGDMWSRSENEIPGEPDDEKTEHSP